MSKSRRKVKHEVPGDGCWFCDAEARKKKFKQKKQKIDKETKKQMK